MSEGGGRERRQGRLQQRYEQLAKARSKNPLAAVVARFNEIDGGDLGMLISLEFFTTIIPLIIIGFSYLSGFADNVSPGNIVIQNFAIEPPLTDLVREAFGSSSGLRSTWTFVGIAGFLVWGIPMTISVAGMFAKAWRREQFTRWMRLGRGSLWFFLYLLMLALRQNIAFYGDNHGLVAVLLFIVALVPVWAFWSVTPLLLVRDGGRGPRFLLMAGLAGVAIDGVIIPLASRLVFPSLLDGMTAFGAIGVAMALLTWCGVIGVGWVVTACAGAVWWERSAPSETVIESQTADPLADSAGVPAAPSESG